MSDLLDKKCVPCEGGVIPFDISEIHKYQKKVDGWEITKNKEEIYFLSKKFEFENFLKSQDFVNCTPQCCSGGQSSDNLTCGNF